LPCIFVHSGDECVALSFSLHEKPQSLINFVKIGVHVGLGLYACVKMSTLIWR